MAGSLVCLTLLKKSDHFCSELIKGASYSVR
jgi:hypothetical protein